MLALRDCHNRKEGIIIHRDIKPGNVFFDAANNVKLGDFGQALHLNDIKNIRDDDVEGDSIYMAPELLSSSIKITDKIT